MEVFVGLFWIILDVPVRSSVLGGLTGAEAATGR